MRLRMLVVPAVLLAIALPAQARAAGWTGIVVAKQPARGTLLLAGPHGVGLTVRGGLGRVRVGERVRIHGARLVVLSQARTATLRGTVLRVLAHGTLLASGRSVVMIHRSARRVAAASDHGRLRPGEVVAVRVRFDDDEDLVEAAPPVQIGQAATARVEGVIVSVSPFVVSLEGLPLTITVPAGTTLPATLTTGRRIELTVQVGAANTFRLVSIEDAENANPATEAQEVEVKGVVAGSTPTQLVVSSNGTMSTFVPQTGTTLPVLPAGTFVEVRGVRQNGTVTLTRLRLEDDGGGHDGGSYDDGGGHH